MKKLKTSGIGCYIVNTYCGSLGYADDMLNPTRYACQVMLNIYESFSKQYNIIFNPEKTKMLLFNSENVSSYEVVFNDHVIDISNCEKHLGSYIGRNSNYTIVMNYIPESNAMLNYLCSIFSGADFNVRYKMFKIYCLSMFNVVLWDLGSSEMSTFYCNWRKSIRKLLNLPLLCHSDFLHRIVNDIPNDLQIKKKMCKFLL